MLAATYRLQFHPAFGFDAAAQILDYLKALGISHVYCSPYLQAAAGSTHGYDIVDHRRVNEELGGAEAHARFLDRLRECGLEQVLDIVPNHMAISGRANPWWWDVLENGPSSLYASYFDIDWQTPEEKHRNKVLLPVLGNRYGRVLKAGEIRLEREGGNFVFRYFDHVFPAAPDSMADLLMGAARRANSDYLAFIADSLARLPLSTLTDPASQISRHRDKAMIRNLLERLIDENGYVANAISASVEDVNHDPDALDALLERQNYRLSFWRAAERDLGYRRFFDINSLVGLRSQNAEVFEDTHGLILEWLHDGTLAGVRVDHPDGLRDPTEYFHRLRDGAPDAWIVAEKILMVDEQLRPWEIDGTTGYDFLNVLNSLYVDRRNAEAFTRIYREFTGETADFPEVALEKKRLVLRDVLGSDVNRLTAGFLQVCERDREHRDYTRHEIHMAIRELVACFPVYRTYVRAEAGEVSPEDILYVQAAVRLAKTNRPDLDAELFDFLEDVLLLRARGQMESEFTMQFQQFTGPAMAKGVEDTAFYCYNRLVSLNEVGGNPGRFGIPLEDFHRHCLRNESRWPRTMLSTSTHDTKRSGDVRIRIDLLSEIPDEWERTLARWSERNERFKQGQMPDRNTEYFLYQNLIGAWPVSLDRFAAYLEKAARESKQHTSWTEPNAAYEGALRGFIEGLFGDSGFLADFEAFIATLIPAGRVQSLSQTLVKLTAPGVPDIYQGTELWDLSLVDPDNRRPVDYELRRRLLGELDHLSPEAIMARADEGLPKLWTIRQSLRVRGRLGVYKRLDPSGEKARHLIAYQRGDVITLAPRLVLGLGGDWGDTVVELPGGTWRNELDGDLWSDGETRVASLLHRFAVALLVRVS